jgi:ribosomal protein S18 acetylase RimI-like enzyme
MIKTDTVSYQIFFDAFKALIAKIYPDHEANKYYIDDSMKGLQYTHRAVEQQASFFCTAVDGQTAGTIALLIDQRLKPGMAFFGFFECNDDKRVFDSLWNRMCHQARMNNIQRLFGPVNGTTWHQYRIVSEGWKMPFFPGEPVSCRYYYPWFMSKRPIGEVSYHSAYRNDYQFIMDHTRKAYEDAVSEGYHFEVKKILDLELLQQIYELSNRVFEENIGFVGLSFDAFSALYSAEKMEQFIGSVYLVRHQDKIIGYSMNIVHKGTLIMKTIAVDESHRKRGIGNALTYLVHQYAKEKEIDTVVYALVNKDNLIKHFPQDGIVVFREYKAMYYSV